MHGYRAIYWGMGSCLGGHIHSNSSSAEWNVVTPSPICTQILSGLVWVDPLHIVITAVSSGHRHPVSPRHSLTVVTNYLCSHKRPWLLQSCHPPFHNVPRARGGRGGIQISRLGLITFILYIFINITKCLPPCYPWLFWHKCEKIQSV